MPDHTHRHDGPPARKHARVDAEVDYDALENTPEPDVDALLEERKRKRAAIMAKYTLPAVQALKSGTSSETLQSTRNHSVAPSDKSIDTPPASPKLDLFDLSKPQLEAPSSISAAHQPDFAQGYDSISAADYNPDLDRLDDDRRQLQMKGDTNGVVGSTAELENVDQSKAALHPAVQQDEDDEDDMFAVDKPERPLDDKPDVAVAVPVINRIANDNAVTIVDNFDDPDGYYRVILGETMDGARYHIHANLGKGMFANVVKAKDTQSEDRREVAIKIVRSQESMYRAGQKEAVILQKLCEADPNDKKHIVRLERTFEHRGHLCLVFESLSMNLRDVIKRFGKDVGINLKAVRAYTHQMFLALSLMRKLNIIHADLKPDNILVNESKSTLKICDLGSATDSPENEITPYLVSRFYRAPEIILGLPYDASLDVWSIGCTLYELYTGKILFPGRTNNHMLLLHQELRGRYPAKLAKKAKFSEIHFEDSIFIYMEKSKTGQESMKKLTIPVKPVSDLKARLMPPVHVKKLKEDELKLLTNFVDLLQKTLELDPTKRITPREALLHPFLR